MILTQFIYPVAILLTSFFSNYSESQKFDFISEFNKIDVNPKVITYTNNFEINNTDGHLQGIQGFENDRGQYVLMTGSSDSYSYCTVVKTGNENKVVSLNKLMAKPFKHAGGFQIFQNYMAVGIEDNLVKDKSIVCIYDISKTENPLGNPMSVIKRNGEPFRSTAGCVGITKFKDKALIIVGDWDSKHLDFYSADFKEIDNTEFKKIGSIDTENISKNGWIDNFWHSYQNINLFNIDEKLYLIGLGQTGNSENVADLFTITEESNHFLLKKVAFKTFNCTNECSFKAGAGIEYTNGNLKIYSCGYNIRNISTLNIFQSK